MEYYAQRYISVVICTKNEEQSIEEAVKRAKPYCKEIIIADGGSTDNTIKIAESLGIKVVQDAGGGKGDGIKAGIKAASGEIIVFMDADLSHNPDDIPRLVGPILENKADHVIGSRALGGSEELHGTLERCLRMIASAIITLGINYRFNVSLSDSQNGFRAIMSNLANRLILREKITTIEQEMTIKILIGGFRISEVPSHEYPRKYGNSCIKLQRVWFRYLYSWIKYLFFCGRTQAIKDEDSFNDAHLAN